jgi:hypothetical protein
MIAEVDVKTGHLAVEISSESKSVRDDLSLAARVDRLGELRRRIVKLRRSSAVIELQNTIWRLSELERRVMKAARRARLSSKAGDGKVAGTNPKAAGVLSVLPEYRQKMATLSDLELKSADAEDNALLMFYGGEAATLTAEKTQVVQEIETGLHELLRQLLDLRHAHPNRVTIGIYSENKDALFELAAGYYSAAVRMEMRLNVGYYTAKFTGEPETIEMLGRRVVRNEVNKPAEFLAHKSDASVGILFSLQGKSAYAMWAGEHGLHTFVEGKTSNLVLVHTSDVEVKDYRPPALLEKRGAIHPTNVGSRRRTYQRAEKYIEDHMLETRRDWQGNLPGLLTFFLERQLQRAAERLIDE